MIELIKLSIIVKRGIFCIIMSPENDNGDIRLSYGDTPNEGTVEIFWDGAWGSICEHEFEKPDGDVVCRQAGYPRGVKEVKEKV